MQEKIREYVFGRLVCIVGVSILIANVVFYLIGALKIETGLLNILLSIAMTVCIYILHVKNEQEWKDYLESRKGGKYEANAKR